MLGFTTEVRLADPRQPVSSNGTVGRGQGLCVRHLSVRTQKADGREQPLVPSLEE